jgi:hypothetical protein
VTASHATRPLPRPERLPAIPVPRCPELRQRDAFNREYLLDIAAAATTRPLPGSLPACWFLLDNREHIEAICRDYGELEAENRLVAEQLDEAKHALTEAQAELAVERATHAATAELLTASRTGAVCLLMQSMLLVAELAATQHALTTLGRRYQALRIAMLMLEVSDELHAEKRSTHRKQSSEFMTVDDVDATRVIDVDERIAMGGAR